MTESFRNPPPPEPAQCSPVLAQSSEPGPAPSRALAARATDLHNPMHGRTHSIPLADGFPDALQALRAQMVDLTLRHIDGESSRPTAIPCLHLIKASCSMPKTAPAFYEPGLAIVLQGRKKVELGTETLYYDPLHFLLVSMPMLPKGGVIEATPDKPYLCVRIDCSTATLAEPMLEVGPASTDASPSAQSGLNVAPVSESLLSAALRLMQLLDNPSDQRVMAPLLQREIFYRVLTGPLGPRLRALAQQDSATRRLSRAIDELEPPLQRSHQHRRAGRGGAHERLDLASALQAADEHVADAVPEAAAAAARPAADARRRAGRGGGGRIRSATRAPRSSAANTVASSARRRAPTSSSCCAQDEPAHAGHRGAERDAVAPCAA